VNYRDSRERFDAGMKEAWKWCENQVKAERSIYTTLSQISPKCPRVTAPEIVALPDA
jgi:hypothetical protein